MGEDKEKFWILRGKDEEGVELRRVEGEKGREESGGWRVEGGGFFGKMI